MLLQFYIEKGRRRKMRNFFVPEYAVMDFEFWDEKNVSIHTHQNVEIFYLLEGNGVMTVDGEDFLVEKGDFHIVNINRRHEFHARREVLFACIHINFNMLIHYIDLNRVDFTGSSNVLKPETCERIQKQLDRIINCYFAKSGAGQIRLNTYYYQLLGILVSDCAVYRDNSRFQNRKQADQSRLNEIINYVYSNYRNEIYLSDLADRLYLTSSYLSKYIKKQLGMNLTDYVNQIRIHYAAEEVENTDRKMTHIALDNGFSNLTAFNKAFRRIYHMTPSRYREQKREEQICLPSGGEGSGGVGEKVRTYLERNEWEEVSENADVQYIIADTYDQQYFTKYWNRMINISRMSDLLMADAQKQILELKEKLGFQYVRFWDIYADELYLNANDPDGNYNFGRMDRIFDFLHENGIYPYIELGFKPVLLVEYLDEYLRKEERRFIFEDNPERYPRFLCGMLSHYINRYGLEEVEKWYFEQWKDERLIDGEDDYQRFFEVFELVYHAIKMFSSKIRVGGGSLHHTFDAPYYESFFTQWKKRVVYPDFLTLYSYPYKKGKKEGVVDMRRSQNPDYLKDQIREIREIQTRLGFRVSEIHVTEWNSSVSNRNWMNDSCYKGAYIMKNIIDNIGNISLLGYWLGLDLFSQYRDMNCVLNGGVGLLSRDGLRKPAYYAFEFLDKLGMYILGKDSNTLVTSNGGDSYYIVTHNYKQPNYKYFSLLENEVDVTNQEQYFENWTKLTQNFQIRHVRNGKYQIKVQKVNAERGSVLDEWIRLGMYDNLTVDELNYLDNAATARIEIWEQTTENGMLDFEVTLEPNEIQHICLLYRF